MVKFQVAGLLTTLALAAAAPSATGQRRLLGNSFAAPGNATFEYVVVGAGNAGLPLAVRLAEGGHTVALIEGGSFYEIGNSNFSQIPLLGPAFTGKDINGRSPQVDWGFQTVAQRGQLGLKSFYPRGKTLGGSSARNFMAYHRGTKGYYQRWADLVGDDSYTWENVLPYFLKSIHFTPPSKYRFSNSTARFDEPTLNGKGPLSVTFGAYSWALESWGKKAWAELGVPERDGFTSGALFGTSNQMLAIDGTEYTRDSSETSFLRKLGLQNPNLMIYPNTLATKILFDGQKKATGVSIDFAGMDFVLTATKEVIASGGAFQSPQLLMVSGIGPQDTLQNLSIPVLANLPGVGKGMKDHTLGGPTYRVNVITSDSMGRPSFEAQANLEYNSPQPHGPYASINGDLLAFEKLPNSSRSALSQRTRDGLATLPSDWPEIEYLTISAYAGPDGSYLGGGPGGHDYASIQAALIAPFSEGSVTINSSDMHDHPVIDPGWLSDERDGEVAVAAYKRIRDVFATKAMQPIVIGDEVYPGKNVSTDAEILHQIRNDFGAVYHASCTCKMGNSSDPMAVVDPQARVYGVTGLRVVDASAFPILQPGHPMATIYMLAEKIADDILKGR